MTDLAREFGNAVRNVTGDDFAALLAAGLSDEALQPSPHLGMANVEVHGSAYEPTETGTKAVIVPVGIWAFPEWDLTDLVAFHLAGLQGGIAAWGSPTF